MPGRHQLPAQIEQIMDSGMDCHESLRLIVVRQVRKFLLSYNQGLCPDDGARAFEH
jgi:hypothetical protein